jgi:putative hydrolase of the HAD superfamily
VSNYPDPLAVRTSLERTGLAPFLDAVVVSGDIGLVKPHPQPFQTCLDQLGLEPAEAVYVGDSWIADVQGAKGLGMQMIHTVQWDSLESLQPRPGDFEPDLVINHLTELETILGGAAGNTHARVSLRENEPDPV